MKLSLTQKKILMIGGPLVAVVGAILLSNKKNKIKEVPYVEPELKDVPKVVVPTPTSSVSVASEFPIKRGSVGENVKTVQRIIGFTGEDVDGKFGPNTEAKLIAFAGISSISSQEELNALIKKSQGLTTTSRAQELLNRFKKGGVSMQGVKQSVATQVTMDVFGAYHKTGKFITIYPGTVYSNNDYSLVDFTKSGMIVFKVNKGNLLGMYLVDPNAITLK